MTPRPLRWLARRFVAGPHAEFILGDLDEGYDAGRRRYGRVVAVGWYLIMSVRSAIDARRTRATGERRVPPWWARVGGELAIDLRMGLRHVGHRPWFSLTVVVVMSLGVGVATFAFGSYYGRFKRGLPVSHPERMVDVTSTAIDGAPLAGISLDDFRDLRNAQTSFDAFALWDAYESVNLAPTDAPPARVTVTHATSAFHRLLEVPPLLGRGLTDDDETDHAPPVLLLSHAFWRAMFGEDSTIVGRTLTVDGGPVTVVGVLPPAGQIFAEDIVLPLRGGSDAVGRRGRRSYSGLGRLAPGVSVRQAHDEFTLLAARLERAHPETNAGIGIRVAPFLEAYQSFAESSGARLLSSIGAVLLLVAVANVANLFLLRVLTRAGEIQLRLALGAGRWRLVRHLISEVSFPVVGGAVVGALLAAEALQWTSARPLAVWEDYRFGAAHLIFVGTVTVASIAAIAGLAAGRVARGDRHLARAERSRGHTSRQFSRVGYGLVVAEIALGGAALYVAGLMVKTAINLDTVDYGFAIEDVMTGTVQLDLERYETPTARLTFWEALRERAEAIPGVTEATLATQLPMIRYRGWSRFRLDDADAASAADLPGAYRNAITPEYFDLFDKRVVRGRAFTAADGPFSEPVVIVNEDFARLFFPDGDALGRRIKLGELGTDRPWMRVVGVAPHMWMDTDVDDHPEGLYVPLAQYDPDYATIAIRVRGNPGDFRDALRATLMAVDPALPLDDPLTMAEVIHDRTDLYRRTGPRFVLLGGIALVLATLGLYAVMAYTARARTAEIGIRVALGAPTANVIGLVLRHGINQITLGAAIGVAVALYVSNGMSRFVFQMSPWDPSVLVASFGVLAATGIAAVWIPARRAARVDPLTALRSEA